MTGDDERNVGLPADPFGAIAEGAAQLHELYLALTGSGFTESQAMYLVGRVLLGTGGVDDDE